MFAEIKKFDRIMLIANAAFLLVMQVVVSVGLNHYLLNTVTSAPWHAGTLVCIFFLPLIIVCDIVWLVLHTVQNRRSSAKTKLRNALIVLFNLVMITGMQIHVFYSIDGFIKSVEDVFRGHFVEPGDPAWWPYSLVFLFWLIPQTAVNVIIWLKTRNKDGSVR